MNKCTLLRLGENTEYGMLMDPDKGFFNIANKDIEKYKSREGIKIIDNPKLEGYNYNYPNAPISAYIIINETCNRKCKHCFHGEMSKIEMTFTLFEGILKELEKVGCFHVNISGGEIFMINKISKYFEIMTKYNLFYSFVSNGDYIDNSSIQLLKSLGKNLNRISISLDGGTKDAHDSIRGKGSYDNSIKALELFNNYDIPSGISFTILKSNHSEASELKNIGQKYNATIKYRSAIRTGTLISSGEYPEYSEYRKFVREYNNKEIIGTSCYVFNKISFTPDGKMSPCMMINDKKGEELFENYNGILDIWQNSPVFKQIRNDSTMTCTRY